MPALVTHAVAGSYRALRQFLFDRRLPVRVARADARSAAGANPPVDPYLIGRLAALRHEQLVCLYYDRAGAFLAERARVGHLARVDFDGAVLPPAIPGRRAHYVIIAHNHPSGSPEPSRADVLATRRLHSFYGTLGMTLVDHAIVAYGGAAFSFVEAGLL